MGAEEARPSVPHADQGAPEVQYSFCVVLHTDSVAFDAFMLDVET